MLICDTSGLLAYIDESSRAHSSVRSAVETDPGPLVISPYALAELDHLVMTRFGLHAELAMLDALSSGAWELAALSDADVRQARNLINRYRELSIGLTDASLVVLAARYRTNRLLTLDQRHFRVVQSLHGRPFELLPG